MPDRSKKDIRLMSQRKISTIEQFIWLDQHGGRTEGDVRKDEKGMYVEMTDGYEGEEKIYLPDQD